MRDKTYAEELQAREFEDGPPPFLQTWPRVYAAVLCYWLALLTSLYLLTRLFGP